MNTSKNLNRTPKSVIRPDLQVAKRQAGSQVSPRSGHDRGKSSECVALWLQTAQGLKIPVALSGDNVSVSPINN